MADHAQCFVALTSADGYRALLSNLGSDPMEPSMTLVTLGPKLPRLVHRFACWVIKSILGDSIFADTFGRSFIDVRFTQIDLSAASKTKSVKDYWYWTDRRDKFAAELNEMVSSLS
jgi:hypothetical protein